MSALTAEPPSGTHAEGDRAGARPFRRRVVQNGAAAVAGNGWSIVVSAVALPLTLKGLGAEAFGVWALVQTFSALTGWLALADLGVATSATRSIATRMAIGDRQGAARFQSTTVAWFGVAGVAGAGLFAVFGWFAMAAVFSVDAALRADLRFVVVLFSVQIVVDFVVRGLQASLEGRNRVDLARASDVLRRTACVGGAAVAAAGGFGLRGVAVASLGGAFPPVLVCALMLRRTAGSFGRPDRDALREMVRYGREIAMLRPIGAIHRTMDRVIVGIALGPAAVSVVEVATQVATAADAVVSASSYTVTPTAAWLEARGERAKVARLLSQGTLVVVLVAMPFVVIPALLAGPLVSTWLDDASSDAATLIVLALGYVALTAPVQVGSNLLVGVGSARSVRRPALLAVAVNLVLSLALVGPMGVRGPFVATLLSSPFLVVPLWRSAAARGDVSATTLVREALRPALVPVLSLATVVGVASVLPVGALAQLLIGAGAGLAVYAVAAVAFAFTPTQRRRMSTLAGRLAA